MKLKISENQRFFTESIKFSSTMNSRELKRYIDYLRKNRSDPCATRPSCITIMRSIFIAGHGVHRDSFFVSDGQTAERFSALALPWAFPWSTGGRWHFQFHGHDSGSITAVFSLCTLGHFFAHFLHTVPVYQDLSRIPDYSCAAAIPKCGQL